MARGAAIYFGWAARRVASSPRPRSRSDMVVLAAVRPQHLSLDTTQHPPFADRLADLVLRPHSLSGISEDSAASLLSSQNLRTHLGELGCHPRNLCGNGDGRGDCTE